MRKEMKVMAIEGPWIGTSALKSRLVPFPTPKENEVVIDICYVGMNIIDIDQTNKTPWYAGRRNPPIIPGIECSGTIIDIGKDVDGWKVGDQVCALLDGGGYAEAVAVRASQVLSIPRIPSITMLQAACLPHVACTTWEALIRIGRLSSKMTLLVYERCGKICELGVQLAKMVQAKVIVVRGDDNKSTFSNAFPPDFTVHVRSAQFYSQVRQASGGEGVDIVLDCEPYSFGQNLSLVKTGGQIVVIKSTRFFDTPVNLLKACELNVTLQVVDRMHWKPEYLASVVVEMRERMWPAFKVGDLKLPSVTPTEYPVSKAVDAHMHVRCFSIGSLYLPSQIDSRGVVLKP